MAGKLIYRSIIGEAGSTEHITWLGTGRAGIVHNSGCCDDLIVVDSASGKELWRQKHYETFGGVTVPLFDEAALYIPLRENSQKLSAHDRETGKQLWTRSMGNGQYAFMVPPAQTRNHIAVCSSNTGKITIVDKIDGQVVSAARTPHKLADYWPRLLAFHDKFIALAADRKTGGLIADLYDPAVEGCFVKTLAKLPGKGEKGEILNQILVGDALYFFTGSGLFGKLDINSGEIAIKHKLPDIPDEYYYLGRHIHCHDGLLCAISRRYDGKQLGWHGYLALKYNPATSELSVTPFEGETHLVQYYKDSAWRLSGKGLVRFALFGNGEITQIPLEDWKNNVSDEVFQNSSDTGINWLIADDKLMAMPLADDDPVDAAGILYCWDLADCIKY
jgi:hypothetical protein